MADSIDSKIIIAASDKSHKEEGRQILRKGITGTLVGASLVGLGSYLSHNIYEVSSNDTFNILATFTVYGIGITAGLRYGFKCLHDVVKHNSLKEMQLEIDPGLKRLNGSYKNARTYFQQYETIDSVTVIADDDLKKKNLGRIDMHLTDRNGKSMHYLSRLIEDPETIKEKILAIKDDE